MLHLKLNQNTPVTEIKTNDEPLKMTGKTEVFTKVNKTMGMHIGLALG